MSLDWLSQTNYPDLLALTLLHALTACHAILHSGYEWMFDAQRSYIFLLRLQACPPSSLSYWLTLEECCLLSMGESLVTLAGSRKDIIHSLQVTPLYCSGMGQNRYKTSYSLTPILTLISTSYQTTYNSKLYLNTSSHNMEHNEAKADEEKKEGGNSQDRDTNKVSSDENMGTSQSAEDPPSREEGDAHANEDEKGHDVLSILESFIGPGSRVTWQGIPAFATDEYRCGLARLM